MTKMSKICCEKMGPILLVVFRIVVGLVFLLQGIYKLLNIKLIVGMLLGLGIPAPEVMTWVLALSETIAGALLILGLFTHLAIIPLLIDMLVAFFTVHIHDGLWGPKSLPGWFVIVLFFGLLAIGCNGWKYCSIDAMATGKK